MAHDRNDSTIGNGTGGSASRGVDPDNDWTCEDVECQKRVTVTLARMHEEIKCLSADLHRANNLAAHASATCQIVARCFGIEPGPSREDHGWMNTLWEFVTKNAPRWLNMDLSLSTAEAEVRALRTENERLKRYLEDVLKRVPSLPHC